MNQFTAYHPKPRKSTRTFIGKLANTGILAVCALQNVIAAVRGNFELTLLFWRQENVSKTLFVSLDLGSISCRGLLFNRIFGIRNTDRFWVSDVYRSLYGNACGAAFLGNASRPDKTLSLKVASKA